MLINESKETGDQGYYNVIKDQAQFIETEDIRKIIDRVSLTDILIYPGRYNTNKVITDLNGFAGRIHIDFHYDREGILNKKTKITNIILSTSSSLFRNQCCGNF